MGAINTPSSTDIGLRTHKLYWFKCKLNHQLIDSVLDSAATQCCIAKRCVTSSPILGRLPLKPYNGQPLLDANQRPVSASHVISVQFVAGTPSCSLSIDVVVVDDLPYSCIIGTSLLAKLESWGVDNVTSTLRLNSSIVPLHDSPQHDLRQANRKPSKPLPPAPGWSLFVPLPGNCGCMRGFHRERRGVSFE